MEIFDYDNILLLPRKCRVQSRGECDPSVEFGPRRFKLPVVPANMKTVLDEPIAEWLAANDHFYVMHRFDIHNLQFAKRMRDKGLYVSISSGVKQADRDGIDQLAAEGVGADYITIDIAHGHADSVLRMIEYIKKRLPGSFVIAGNVATPEAVIDLEAGRHLPGLQQPGDARRQHPRLARAGAGQDQRGFSRQRHRRPLPGVQVVQQLAGGGRRNIGRPLALRRVLSIGG
jgi:hypothetical protein